MEIPEGFSDAALWAIIVGFAQPFVLQFILQTGWSKRLQALVAFGVSIITGGVTAYFAGAFEGLSIVSTILLVSVVSISSYKGFWKDTTPELKEATTLDSQKSGHDSAIH